MPRKSTKTLGQGKKIIRVFCEGESEQAYTEYLKNQFSEVAVIRYPSRTGLFEEADRQFKNNPQYRDYTNEIDEVWFFFDVETKDKGQWDERLGIIKRLRKLKKKPGIKIRLLMTTGCIEYWLMLHYKYYIPPLKTVADKEKVLRELLTEEPSYEKGNTDATALIAAHYPRAVNNARKTLTRLLSEGMPDIEESDNRNRWLCNTCFTFSNVFEAIDYLQSLTK